jgi:1-deoxy-D-xylulose-5-phosphate reductoisomerase
VDFSKLGALTFEKPDRAKFPCLRLAEEAAREGGSATAVLNAANEVAVDAFLKGALDFYGIPRTVERVLSAHRAGRVNSLAQAFAADAWAREEAARILTG